MDFNDSPEEAAWRDGVPRRGSRPTRRRSSSAEPGRHAACSSRAATTTSSARQALAGAEVRRRVRAHHVGARVRRPQRHDDAADHLRPGRGAVRRADRGVRDRPRHDRADVARVRHRRAAAALPHQAAARRGDLEPAVQRAGRRLRRRVALDHRRPRRRRVGDQRPEGLDVGRAVLRLRRDRLPHEPRSREAQGHHRVHRRHARARASRSSRSSR